MGEGEGVLEEGEGNGGMVDSGKGRKGRWLLEEGDVDGEERREELVGGEGEGREEEPGGGMEKGKGGEEEEKRGEEAEKEGGGGGRGAGGREGEGR